MCRHCVRIRSGQSLATAKPAFELSRSASGYLQTNIDWFTKHIVHIVWYICATAYCCAVRSTPVEIRVKKVSGIRDRLFQFLDIRDMAAQRAGKDTIE